MRELERAAELIADAPSVALACHVHPDGDALGSLLGMHHLCRANGKQSVASWPDPFVLGPHYAFLPGIDGASPPSEFPDRADVVITFDSGSLARLGNLAHAVKEAGELVVLDHHADNTRYGSVNVIDLDAAATAVVVRKLAGELGWELSRDAAFCLYVGLVTDTGRFQYPNTTPEVFHLAEELASYGLPIMDITRELFEKHRFVYVKMAAEVLTRAEFDPERHFVAAWVTADDLDRYGVEFDETEGLIDLVRRTAEAEVACVLKEAPGEGIRVSLRSVSDIDVGTVAAALGGGGHAYMSGFTSERSIEETIEQIKSLLPTA